MADIWVISDTHFNHANILNFKDKSGKLIRPFHDVHEMNEHMIDRWNKLVKPQDKIYHLGDVAFGNWQENNEILKRLNGKKRLILGNHDNGQNQVILKQFDKIVLWRKFKEFGLLLTHVPVHPSTLEEPRFESGRYVNVHGHIHQNKSPDGPYHCVCVEHTDYMPVNIEKLRIR